MRKTSKEIKEWLDSYRIKNYTLVPDQQFGYRVNVEGDVVFPIGVRVGQFEVKFGVVTGVFDCSDNQLATILGAPDEVMSYFDCSHNNLVSLEGGPVRVGGMYDCSHNKLESLKGAAQFVGGKFRANDNNLGDIASLVGFPTDIKGRVSLNNNPGLEDVCYVHDSQQLRAIIEKNLLSCIESSKSKTVIKI